MKSSPDIVKFSQPLLGVRLVGAPTDETVPPAELKNGERAAYERGRRDAERELAEQLRRQHTEFIALQNSAVASLRNGVAQAVRDSEPALVALALEVARKLVNGLPITPEMIEGAVREALAQVEETSDTIVQLHPEDFALLQQANSPYVTRQNSERIAFEASLEISRGGCRVQTRFGVIDGRRETKFELLQKALLP
ncbi:MAG: hypothetical protein HY300_08615 [Verrucomicrobia bacterium]|nr:hypothetical protein [Verrucomicrobiota bacterium]